MELTPLRYFVKLADVLSFTEAARELFVTQSTLSQSIKQLEGELGTALFDRVGKKVYLTDSGADFLGHARKALEEVEYGVQHMQEMQHVYSGRIKIGVIYSFFSLLNICVLKFTRAYPQAQLSIVYSHYAGFMAPVIVFAVFIPFVIIAAVLIAYTLQKNLYAALLLLREIRQRNGTRPKQKHL